MTSVQIDMSEVRELAADMRSVEPLLAHHIKPAVAKGALNIKQQLKAEAAQKWWNPRKGGGLPPSISYDLIDAGFGAEIGPDKEVGSGALGVIAYFGGSNGGGGTLPDPRGALDAEADRFVSALTKLAEGLLA